MNTSNHVSLTRKAEHAKALEEMGMVVVDACKGAVRSAGSWSAAEVAVLASAGTK